MLEVLNTMRTEALSSGNRSGQLLGNIDFIEHIIRSMQQQQTAYHRNIAELGQENLSIREELALTRDKLHIAEERIRLQIHELFGKKSEKWQPDEKQARLVFNELEALLARQPEQQDATPATQPDEVQQADVSRRRIDRQAHIDKSDVAGRKPLPQSLPRVVTCLDREEDLARAAAGELVRIGEDISERLCVNPRTYYVEKVVRSRFAVMGSSGAGIMTADAPFRIIPKSIASPSLLALLLTAKFCDSLPFYRQANILVREGIDISRGTMARWAMQAHELLMPLMEFINARIMGSPVIQMDETRVRVLHDSNHQKITGNSWLWCRAAVLRDGKDATAPPLRLYSFACDLSRGKEVARGLLNGYTGILVSDAYASYTEPARTFGIVHAGCMAHVRRKFHDVLKVESGNPYAAEAIKIIGVLYDIERQYATGPLGELLQARQTRSKPVMAQFWQWLLEQKKTALPKSLLGKATDYAVNSWSRLLVYLDNPLVPIDNMLVENAIRPFAVGRRNWLFFDQTRGADASAVLYSIIVSANANNVEPMHYLQFLFNCYERFGSDAMPWPDLLPTPKIREYADRIGVNWNTVL
ncbi:MAG: IS66 family transposase [Spirochaetota bacterium]